MNDRAETLLTKSEAGQFILSMFLGLATLCLGLRLPLYSQVALVVFAAWLLLPNVNSRFKEISLGITIPLLPVLGSGTLLSLAMVYCLCRPKRELSLAWAKPFLIISGLSSALSLISEISIFQCFIYDADLPLLSWFSSFRAGPPASILGFESWLRIFVLALLLSRWSAASEERQRVKAGIIWASPILAGVVFYQYFFGSAGFPNQNPFFLAQNRLFGTLTDPNALGVSAFLILIILWPELLKFKQLNSRLACSLLAIAVLVAGLLSGSRSLVLGLVLFSFGLLLLHPIYRNRAILVCGILVLGFITAIQFISVDIWPASISRIIDSLTSANPEAGLQSRWYFLKATTLIWWDFPLSGIGWGRVREVFPIYADALNLGTGAWSDNSNNFYIGILAELGIIGLIALYLSIQSLDWKIGANRVAQAGVVVFAILLFFGPHFEFDEVAVLFAVLAAGVVAPGKLWISNKTLIVLSLLYLVFSPARVFNSEKGFYAWERDGTELFRWTGPRAAGRLACGVAGKANIILRSSKPENNASPLRVKILTALGQSKELILHSGQILESKLNCKPGAQFLSYKLQVSGAWTPASLGMGQDARLLGVQVRGIIASDLMH